MAKILSFRTKNGATSEPHFLTDEHKLSFQQGDDGVVSLGDLPAANMPAVLPDPKKDWTNQELADLFRVCQLLTGAGVPVDTMRGITDEGDPWFVYCHLNGDVFIHMARIDGAYVLDSPNVQRALRGRDFNELIDDFTSGALPSYTQTGEDEDTERRVVKLERGGKVQLHPSAMLAALIWTLYMASEELVMMIQEEEALAGDDLLDFTDMISADLEHQVVEMDTADIESLVSHDSLKDLSEEVLQTGAEGTQVQMRDQGIAMQQNAYAMGLSTIAIAMGFMSEAVLLDNQRKVLEGLKNIGFTQYAADTEAGPELEQIAGEGNDALLAKLAEFLGLDLGADTQVAEVPSARKEAALLSDEDAQQVADVVEDTTVAQKVTPAVVRKDSKDAELAEAPDVDAKTIPVAQDKLITMASAELDESETLTMSDLLGSKVEMEEFQLGKTTVLASFDLTNTDVFALSDLMVNQRTTNHRAFDEQAQAFIDYIQGKDTDVGVINIGNEIIMIDRSAFQNTGADTYTFSWETDEGQVISMIGLRAEFQQFDLIA